MQRIGFGLLLIVGFSVGLAAVLITIGLLMVSARQFMSRFQVNSRLTTRWLPLTSSAFYPCLRYRACRTSAPNDGDSFYVVSLIWR